MARPPTYTTDAERPVSVSLRIPRDLYDQIQHLAHMRRMTLTALVIEGLRLCLDTPVDSRDVAALQRITETQSITEIRELKEMIAAEVQQALQAFSTMASAPPAPPVLALSHDDNITVVQEPHTQAQSAHTIDEPVPFDKDRAVISETHAQPRPDISHDSNAVIRKRAKPTLAKGQPQDFDRDKFHLGPLCHRKHEYGNTGKSLRRNHKHKNQQHCLECVRENNRTYVQNKRPATSS